MGAVNGILKLLALVPAVIKLIKLIIAGTNTAIRQYKSKKLEKELAKAIEQAKGTKDTTLLENLFK